MDRGPAPPPAALTRYRVIAEQGSHCRVLRACSVVEAFEMGRALRQEGWEVAFEPLGSAA